jgi:hypothetical protein
MKPGDHMPSEKKKFHYNQEVADKTHELEESFRDLAYGRAEFTPWVNDWGTKLTKCGTRNGITVMPTSEKLQVVVFAV